MKRILLLGFILLGIGGSVWSQKVNEPVGNPEWVKPYKPFRIAGNLYYVGTYDLASYLIVTNKGNILINTGLSSSAGLIKKNIEALGFKFSDIKILLTNQAHYDHLGAMAAIKKQTEAKFYVNAADAEVCKTGGATDYEMSHLGRSFQPVIPDRLLKDKDIIQLGNTRLIMLHHPGHTKGSCSFLLNIPDGKRLYKVLIANIPTIITDRNFSEIPAYPGIRNDYAYTIPVMKQLQFDLWVAAHASQFGLHTKRKEGDAYNPAIFADRKGYDKVLKEVSGDFKNHP
ncbi:subclass B3 metallo-beta-lactamase [Niabella sp. 22666]|uniref:subclass B3 metallo-beta-lactamase n=1 Tax=Niabella sp. 22666 TaxID=3453954 RepID=UPI003F85B9DD